MEEYLRSIKEENYDVIYVTGKSYFDAFPKDFSKNVHIVPYIDNMSALIKDIDILVTRAGASVISEIMALGKPSILIPSPYVANNHQYYNAKSLSDANAGIMIEEKDLTKDKLKEEIRKYLKINLSKYATKVQNVVLGCTHYPLIQDEIKEVLGDVEFFNGAESLAKHLKSILEEKHLINTLEIKGNIEFIDSSELESKKERFFHIMEKTC